MPKGQLKAADHLTVDGRQIPLTNLQKVLYPEKSMDKGAGDRLLYPGRAVSLAVSQRSTGHLKAVSGRSRGRVLLWKGRARFHAGMGQNLSSGRVGAAGPIFDTFSSMIFRRSSGAPMPPAWELHPFLHQVPEISKPTSLVFDLRSWRRRRCPRLCGRRLLAQRCAVAARARNICERLRFQRNSGLRAAELSGYLRSDATLRALARRILCPGTSEENCSGDGQKRATRQSLGRLESEFRFQDHSWRVFPASQAPPPVCLVPGHMGRVAESRAQAQTRSIVFWSRNHSEALGFVGWSLGEGELMGFCHGRGDFCQIWAARDAYRNLEVV